MKLTAKQEKQYRLFAQEYLINNFNGTKAAIVAGYSEKTASSQASRLLSHAKVQEFIEEYGKEREKRTEITSDMVVKELAKVAFHDIRKLYDEKGELKHMSELDDETAAVLSSFKSRKENKGSDDNDIIEEYKRHDKLKSLELLGKHLGMFTEKIVTDNTHKFEVSRSTVEPTKQD